jgi:hypothetical protein
MREKLLDPTGTAERAVDTTLSSRLRSLRGLTAGLLENGKPNAAALLTETGRELRDRWYRTCCGSWGWNSGSVPCG